MKKLTHTQQFNEIINHIENRCMAMDGPVGSTLNEATDSELHELWDLIRQIQGAITWNKASEIKPPENVSVLVFIPQEDNHVTTGMWDVSKKWVLLDDYRVPTSEVTYWRHMVDLPDDQEYNEIQIPDEDEKTDNIIAKLQKQVFDLEKRNRELKDGISRLCDLIG